MVKECGHCFNQVLPLEDGTCPACRNNMSAPSRHPSHITACMVRRDDNKPDLCIFCGENSTRTMMVEEKCNEVAAESNQDRHVVSLAGFFGLAMIRFKNRKPTKWVVVDLPVCDLCSGNKPEILNVLHEQEAIRLIVHRRFRDEFQTLNTFG